MIETWKTVDLNTAYEVSNMGHIRRTTRVNGGKRAGKSLGYNLDNGYREIVFFDDKHNRIRKLVHQVVSEAFLGKIPVGMEVNHKDGNKRNNKLSNLEYVTPSQNIQHAIRTGLMKPVRGTRIGTSKLTPRQVRRIRQRYDAGASMADIARRMKLGLTTVGDICNRRSWRHL
jgi:hypothetical protein